MATTAESKTVDVAEVTELDPLQGLSASDKHFVRQRMSVAPGSKPLRLRFSRPSAKEAVDRFVDAEAARHGDRASKWKTLDMRLKWQYVQDYIATGQAAGDLTPENARQALLEGRLNVVYDSMKRCITNLERVK